MQSFVEEAVKQENNTVRSNVGDGNEYGDDGVDVGTCVIVFVTLDCLVFYLGGDFHILYINIYIDYCRADPIYIIVLGSG